MGKAHRDNHAARINRGAASFDKKTKRRAAVAKDIERRCNLCGGRSRYIEGGLCLKCRNR